MYSNLSKKANTREATLIVMIWTLIWLHICENPLGHLLAHHIKFGLVQLYVYGKIIKVPKVHHNTIGPLTKLQLAHVAHITQLVSPKLWGRYAAINHVFYVESYYQMLPTCYV